LVDLVRHHHLKTISLRHRRRGRGAGLGGGSDLSEARIELPGRSLTSSPLGYAELCLSLSGPGARVAEQPFVRIAIAHTRRRHSRTPDGTHKHCVSAPAAHGMTTRVAVKRRTMTSSLQRTLVERGYNSLKQVPDLPSPPASGAHRRDADRRARTGRRGRAGDTHTTGCPRGAHALTRRTATIRAHTHCCTALPS
jgi:hypothetical protein